MRRKSRHPKMSSLTVRPFSLSRDKSASFTMLVYLVNNMALETASLIIRLT